MADAAKFDKFLPCTKGVLHKLLLLKSQAYDNMFALVRHSLF